MLPKALKSCLKSNKLPNLVTLVGCCCRNNAEKKSSPQYLTFHKRNNKKEGSFPSSVTRWLEYLLKIWPFATMKICPMAQKNCQIRFKICLIVSGPSKFYKVFKNFSSKGQKLAKFGHTLHKFT